MPVKGNERISRNIGTVFNQRRGFHRASFLPSHPFLSSSFIKSLKLDCCHFCFVSHIFSTFSIAVTSPQVIRDELNRQPAAISQAFFERITIELLLLSVRPVWSIIMNPEDDQPSNKDCIKCMENTPTARAACQPKDLCALLHFS